MVKIMNRITKIVESIITLGCFVYSIYCFFKGNPEMGIVFNLLGNIYGRVTGGDYNA